MNTYNRREEGLIGAGVSGVTVNLRLLMEVDVAEVKKEVKKSRN